jgi:hypothetical protein
MLRLTETSQVISTDLYNRASEHNLTPSPKENLRLELTHRQIILLCIYRLTLHPYAKYPGPILAKLTSLRAVHYAHTGDMHLDIERCHQKYGETSARQPIAPTYVSAGKFVRYRPNAIIVNSPEGYQGIPLPTPSSFRVSL